MNEKLIEVMTEAYWAASFTSTPSDAMRAALRTACKGEVFGEMVERACGAYFDGDGYQWDESAGADHVRASMRLALRAALLGDDNVTT